MSGNPYEPVRLSESRIRSPEPGLCRQVLAYTQKLMMVRHIMDKGWVGIRHSHPHEQLVYVVRGHIRAEMKGIVLDAHAGDSFVVPGGVEHQAHALEESEVLDVFTPFRQEYVETDA